MLTSFGYKISFFLCLPVPTPTYYAHSFPSQPSPTADWQLLRDHLQGVAQLARAFAAATGVPDLPASADAAGWLHDLGKYRETFQRYIRGLSPGGPKGHKQAGAVWSNDADQIPITAAILGHHGGMPNVDSTASQIDDPDNGRAVYDEVWNIATAECTELLSLAIAPCVDESPATDLFSRLLFSCLVDADWTDTAANVSRGFRDAMAIPPPELDAATRLTRLLATIAAKSDENRTRNPSLAELRGQILTACLNAADASPRLFSLTVPTGGGKTLSALAFALKHAAAHGLRRVIYVAPFISILEQNAKVIRDALGVTRTALDVFEHQSLAEPQGPAESDPRRARAAARQAETWDSPIVVTTNVQFFHSLFSNQPGACRKLHNIAKSVVILDECQSLPPDLVKPMCQMLNQLATTLGCSVVLCTATQPAFDHETLGSHRLAAREIVPPDLNLFDRLKRVQIHWPRDRDERLTWVEVARRMADRTAALCVVNTKAAARDLFAELQSDPRPAFHLSTAMCPRHRQRVLKTVQDLLDDKANVSLVSTQLIEAGVDIDFPAVFREMGPLEAIIQAAGRCNREGLIPDAGGWMEVFRSIEGKLPPNWYARGKDVVETAFLTAGVEPRIDNACDIRDYYQHLYWSGAMDKHNICGMRAGLRFEDCAKTYKLIEDETVPLVVATWKGHEIEVEKLLNAIRAMPTRENYRALAPYQVNVFRSELTHLSKGLAVPLDEDSDVLVWRGLYDADVGRVSAFPGLDEAI